MKRVVLVLVVLVVVALGLTVLVDRLLIGSTARGIQSDIEAAGVELSEDAEVRVEGFPFLTQLMGGRLREVNLTAQSATVDGLELQDVQGVARGVQTEPPYVAREAELTMTVPTQTVLDAVERSELSERGLDIDVEIRGAGIVVSTTFIGVPVEAVLRPAPAGRDIFLELRSISLAGLVVRADQIPEPLKEALDDLSLKFAGLPEGLEVSQIRVLPDGLLVTATGADVALESLALEQAESRPAES